MITLFTTPKPFHGHEGIIQRNAIRSWRHLSKQVEIILFGDASGCEEMAREVGAVHLKNVESHRGKAPYLDAMFTKAQITAKNNVLCYINADIIVPSNFVEDLLILKQFENFLGIGYRFDLDYDIEVDFHSPEAIREFWTCAERNWKQHPATGIDFFCFKKGLWKTIPRFIIGRMSWDNWLIWQARRYRVPVVDVTKKIKVVHQNHDYFSLDPRGEEGIRRGKEAEYNSRFLKKDWAKCTLEDATWNFGKNGLRKKSTPEERKKNYERLWRIYPEIAHLLIYYNKLSKLVDRAFEKRMRQKHSKREPV